MKTTKIIIALLLIGGSAFAGTYRVHYSIRGNGRDITILADSASEARRTVMDMFPDALVTGTFQVRK
jgi:hypothetical protein